MPTLPENLSDYVQRTLAKKGVEAMTSSRVMTFHREEARGCKRIVGIAQTPRQHLHHVAVDFRAGFPNCVEIRLAYKIQFGVAERRGSWPVPLPQTQVRECQECVHYR